MSRICAVELKASQAILVALEPHAQSGEVSLLTASKITLEDDESIEAMQHFQHQVQAFANAQSIDTFVIKKRAKKGTMAGGAISFKMEAAIQLSGCANVELLSAQSIAAADKKHHFLRPATLKKYQEAAFITACTYLNKFC
ncbi:MAG: DUF3010 family protein [Pseudomonadales bacterium]